jgi:hypothetical protein
MNKSIYDMTPEEILNIPLLGLDDTFPFACKTDNGEVCGKCCRNRHDLLLTAYDVFRLARHFKCETSEIIKKYCTVYEGQDSKLPVVKVVTKSHNDTCPFLRKGRCSLHFSDCKPILCRCFPLAKISIHDGKRGYYHGDLPSCGVPGGQSVVRDWVGDAASEEANAASDAWTEMIGKTVPILQKLSKGKSSAHQHPDFYIAFMLMYLNYDIDKDFAEQCRANTGELLRGLKISKHKK